MLISESITSLDMKFPQCQTYSVKEAFAEGIVSISTCGCTYHLEPIDLCLN